MGKYTVNPNRVIDFSGCKKGKHPYKIIQSMSVGHDEEAVVRWCPKCGAITVDMDYDNRRYAGYYTELIYPEITLKNGLE